MPTREVTALTATAAAAEIARGTMSAEDCTRACLERIAAVEGEVRAFAHLDSDHVLAQARALDLESGLLPPRDLRVDAIVCMQVFEHLLEPLAVAERFVEMLNPGGALIFDYLTSEGAGLDSLAGVRQRDSVLAFIEQRFDIIHIEHRMTHAERPRAEAGNRSPRLKRVCRNCRVVKHFQSVSCRILKQDEIGNVTFTGQPARAAVNRNTMRLQPRRECVERRRVSHLPPEETQPFGIVSRDD